MKDLKGGYRFFKLFLTVAVILQLAACGKVSHSAPVFTSADSTTLTEGITQSFVITASNATSFSESGTLPSGVTFDGSSGTLSGTPSTGSNGTYPLTITAFNGSSSSATQSFTITVTVAATTVMIITDGTTGTTEADMVTNLSNILTSSNLSANTNVGVPDGSLTGLKQIWDVRYNNTVLTGTEVTSYQAYVNGGGTLAMIGGPTPGFDFRNNSILSLINTFGGGNSITLTVASTMQSVVLSPFSTNVSSVTYGIAPAGAQASPGNGAFITDTNNVGTAIFFDKNKLTVTPGGRLMVVFDYDFLESSASSALKTLTANMVTLP